MTLNPIIPLYDRHVAFKNPGFPLKGCMVGFTGVCKGSQGLGHTDLQVPMVDYNTLESISWQSKLGVKGLCRGYIRVILGSYWGYIGL